jgi:hypothetical protein
LKRTLADIEQLRDYGDYGLFGSQLTWPRAAIDEAMECLGAVSGVAAVPSVNV